MRRGDAIVAGLLVVAAAAFSLAAPEGHSLAGASPTFQGANLDEVADPGVPAANVVRLWAEDVESLAIANSSGTAYLQVTADGSVDLGTTAGATDGTLSTGTHLAGSGTAGAPSYSFSGDTNTGFYRTGVDTVAFAANGVQQVTVSPSGMFGYGVVVTAKTGNYTLNATSERARWFTNQGAAGTITFTLPAGGAGHNYGFARIDSQEVRIDPGAADKILDIDMTGLTDGEYITTSADKSTIKLVGLSTGDWVVVSKTGTWAEQTP